MNEEYITQVSVEIEKKLSKKVSQEYSWTDKKLLRVSSKLDEHLQSSQVSGKPVNILGTSRNSTSRNQDLKEDYFQNNLRPDVMSMETRMPHITIPELIFVFRNTQ